MAILRLRFTRLPEFLMRILFLAALLAAPAFPQNAPQPAPALTAQQLHAIDSFVSTELTQRHIPGAAVGIYSRGNILLAKGYGLANVELSVPVKPETLFQSGSVGKQFISAAIMMLVEDHKLSLDDSITKYFPDAPSTWKPILIKNLLSHTSGLAEYEAGNLIFPTGPFYLRLDFTEDQLVTKIQALPIENAPGDKWNYRNTNYLLLGILIHRVAGMPYTDFLTQRIFKPLGMSSTRPISESDIIPNRAAGYELHGNQLKNQEWVSPTFNATADGTLYFNVLDLAKWDAALYTTQLLEQSSVDRLFTVFPLTDGKPNPSNYGFGWFIRQQNNHKLIEHGGAWQGFTCDISRYPDDNLTIVVLTNLDAAHSDPDLIAHTLAGLVNPALAPTRLDGIPDTQPTVAATLTQVLNHLSAGDELQPFFSDSFAPNLTPNTIAASRQTLAPLWPGGSLTLVKRLAAPDAPTTLVSLFRLSKADQALLILIFTGPDGKISNFRFFPNREVE